MMTTVTARHCEITDLLRKRAISVMDRLEHFSLRLEHGLAVQDGLQPRISAQVQGGLAASVAHDVDEPG